MKILPPHAGLRTQRKARSTGTTVGLYNSREAGLDDDPSCKWSTVCEDHGGIVGHETLQQANM